MAQDFYKAFGHDAIGETGCDSLINQQEFLGVNFIAIQALEKRTADQVQTIRNLQSENNDLKKEMNGLIKRMEVLEKILKP